MRTMVLLVALRLDGLAVQAGPGLQPLPQEPRLADAPPAKHRQQSAVPCGVGFRWFSPFEPLRLDWAFPMNRRPGGPNSTLQFGFGSVF